MVFMVMTIVPSLWLSGDFRTWAFALVAGGTDSQSPPATKAQIQDKEGIRPDRSDVRPIFALSVQGRIVFFGF